MTFATEPTAKNEKTGHYARIADLEKALAEQRALLAELGAVVSDYRQRLNTAEASAHTGLSKSRLDNLRFAGGGPKFLKLGRLVRYRVSDLDEWMDARLVENTSMLPRRY